jgi:hypothetical protein
VAGGRGSLVVQTSLHRRGWWVLVPLVVANTVTIEMVLDTGSLLSGVSEATQQTLAANGLLEPSGERRFVLRRLAIQGQPVPDLVVRPSRRVTQAGASGVLGLDFFGRFTDIHFHVPSMRLTLTL